MRKIEPQSGLSISSVALGALVTLGGLGSAGCYPKSAPAPGSVTAGSVTWATAKFPEATEASLNEGRESFLAKCNACHGYPDLAEHTDEEWGPIVERMGSKSDLDAAKTKNVLHYVLAARHP